MRRISFPEAFPQRDYVPHGYLDNPFHTSVLNRSGVFRSVPPLGFGFWCRRMPWAYGDGTRRQVNYLSLFQPSFVIDGRVFHEATDFEGVKLVSRYHTKNAMTYDWQFADVEVRLTYFAIGEHTLACVVELENTGAATRQVSIHAGHMYGYNETRWWGSDGFTSRRGASGEAVAKIWAYGDVFAMVGPGVYHATHSREEWRDRVVADDVSVTEGVSTQGADPVISVLTSTFELGPSEVRQELFTLTRGVNELWTCDTARRDRERAFEVLNDLLSEDAAFYASAPRLAGDWPDDWKSGWIYDLETLRMCARQPTGIFRRRWDGMQIFSPRLVLGESVIDAMCLSYADPVLAQEMILCAFADAPMPNVPCTREDGSMNMVSMGGEECGTAPIWVLPFLVIRSVFERTQDTAWLIELYPYLEKFVQWWLDNRRDEAGRFFCNNSWESGQDGSQRFLIGKGEEGKEAEFVQTVDVEAAMADAMLTLAALAPFAGAEDRAARWQQLGEEVAQTTRAMFVNGCFRDFDARTGEPIILPEYRDVMMLLPLSVDIATTDQVEAIRPHFQYFIDNPKHWLEWPSFLFCYTEAGWNAGLREEMAAVVATTANRVYRRTNGDIVPVGRHHAEMPEPYNYRIPGTANEYWPIEPATLANCSSEAYGWGATLPTLILRNIIGLRETSIDPVLPASMRRPGAVYRIRNLFLGHKKTDVEISISTSGEVQYKVN